MSTEIRVIIADDHPIFRKGLRGVIEADPRLKVVGEAADGEASLVSIREHKPDVAVLDLDMPGIDGFGVARSIQSEHLPVKVIILTMHDSESLFNAALDLAVKGFVLKDSALPEIIDCIKAVAAGRNYLSPQLSTYLINRNQRATTFVRETPTLKQLTPAERNILKLIAHEKSSRQIADELHISIRTVDRHRANICDKLDLHGPNALIRFAVANRSDL